MLLILIYRWRPIEQGHSYKFKSAAIFLCYIVTNVKTLTRRKVPQIKFAFLREQLLLAAALLWWKCNKASVSVQQIENKQLTTTYWIPICAWSHQVSLLGRSHMHAKDSAKFNCSNKITDGLSFVLRVKPITSLLEGQGDCCWSMRSRWYSEAVMNCHTLALSAVVCRESCETAALWLLTAVCTVSANSQCWLCSAHAQPSNSHSYPGQQWGMRLLVKTLAN